ncbi:hypothetical protein DFA_10477 [Cavenderia fasciculata]|uniref:Uncharacterized protein n=1 Tax=Cavenderia fasciculata TaxID=261658 RepID=F4QAB6_CACFS|nr:uncharacterized protein DFA_10477 [Cavenderia fasciculata]EGG15635.1 hypothetical protein DFA_10477 [Cavenderia fasciculata]|eukprot:XP_004354377.1 hypothetical protein DFA_10477 [Cavenderia fasciculata]
MSTIVFLYVKTDVSTPRQLSTKCLKSGLKEEDEDDNDEDRNRGKLTNNYWLRRVEQSQHVIIETIVIKCMKNGVGLNV